MVVKRKNGCKVALYNLTTVYNHNVYVYVYVNVYVNIGESGAASTLTWVSQPIFGCGKKKWL